MSRSLAKPCMRTRDRTTVFAGGIALWVHRHKKDSPFAPRKNVAHNHRPHHPNGRADIRGTLCRASHRSDDPIGPKACCLANGVGHFASECLTLSRLEVNRPRARVV